MPRGFRVYLDDMIEACADIMEFTSGYTLDEFVGDKRTYKAVLHNFMIIGEAVRNVPDHVRIRYPEVHWPKIAGLRNLVVHEYFGIDLPTIRTIVQSRVPTFHEQLKRILAENE